jgi:hypothetical protein
MGDGHAGPDHHEGVRVDIAMLETSDGHGRLELMKFHAPPARALEPALWCRDAVY